MDTSELYKFIHLLGLCALFLGLGGILMQTGEGKPPKLFLALHAGGLVAMLVAGFGRAARLGFHLNSGWIMLKIVCWLVLGAMPVLVRKGYVPKPMAWLVALLVAAAAIYLAIEKPWTVF